MGTFKIRGNEVARETRGNKTLIITGTAPSVLVQAARRIWESAEDSNSGWERKPWKDHFLTVTAKTH
jgi:hypothetical protein